MVLVNRKGTITQNKENLKCSSKDLPVSDLDMPHRDCALSRNMNVVNVLNVTTTRETETREDSAKKI